MNLSQSPITQHCFEQIPFFLKRDDQLHSHFSGNKARKFMSLLKQDLPGITTLICYGSAQSNALYSLAALARIKGWQLEFYVDHIAPWQKQRPTGNYRGALDLGAHILDVRELSSAAMHPRDYITQIRQPGDECLVVPEGGRSREAEAGVRQLGMELLSWARFQVKQPLVVALPAGTGATALYLHKTLKPHGIEVLTCPCVSGTEYLRHQFHELGEQDHPQILTLDHKHHFGKLYRDDYRTWQALLDQTDVEFDLLYDPMMWRCLLNWYHANRDKTLLYIHQGGILGNESMLPRYQRKFD
ncbi:pyridoxal-phosphate dependent enzyme [Vibrio proteolyticus]|uniref:Tryptophan synthase beta chain-like PALP domain-containing protein n=1 Tax=Vibrio proteolyticus NBRC 13287 TaxID=1219065 RepID=U2ZX72_VIBPR|nr:pyridoxal-phosphate dependent enzyme [Vibrio proteolyticus]GAD65702.1 hypothetical protein VPR01S_01_04760 [Vibrio proteolyticus NBRC 13287]